jgi:hypothetical protein
MPVSHFGFTTRQTADLLEVNYHTLYRSHARLGSWRGITPRVLPNGRLLWPRVEVLKLRGEIETRSRKRIDLRPWLAFWAPSGLPVDDLAISVGVHLLQTEIDSEAQIESHAYEGLILWRQINEAFAARLFQAWSRLDPKTKATAMELVAQVENSVKGTVNALA